MRINKRLSTSKPEAQPDLRATAPIFARKPPPSQPPEKNPIRQIVAVQIETIPRSIARTPGRRRTGAQHISAKWDTKAGNPNFCLTGISTDGIAIHFGPPTPTCRMWGWWVTTHSLQTETRRRGQKSMHAPGRACLSAAASSSTVVALY
jgi:hypothetical protein